MHTILEDSGAVSLVKRKSTDNESFQAGKNPWGNRSNRPQPFWFLIGTRLIDSDLIDSTQSENSKQASNSKSLISEQNARLTDSAN